MIFKKDNLLMGIIIGVIAPLLAMYLYYYFAFSKQINFSQYIYYMRSNKSLITGISSISLVANALFFSLYINFKKDKTAKGIFLSTVVYGIGILLLKLLI